MLEFGEFLPDQAKYASPGATNAKNCLPLTNRSYGPLPALTSVVDALSNRVQGAASLQQASGAQFTFCGDNQNLFKLGTTAFAEISKSTNAYTTALDDRWNILQYGDRVVALNGHTDAPQSYLMGTSSDFADLAGSPPYAKHQGVVNNFVMFGNIKQGSDVVPNRVHWCAINNPTDWPTIGSADAASKQSDRQDLPTGLTVMSITGAVGGADGAVFMRESIYRVSYEGAPLVFSFTEVERGRGTLAGSSVVNVGPFAFFLAEQGFFVFDGSQSTSIGSQKVDKFFFDDLDFNFIDRITGAADPKAKLVWWSYTGQNNRSGVPNKLIIYNWETQRWSYGEVEVQLIFNDTSVGYNLDQLNPFGNLETIETSFDDRFWVGGFASLSAFSQTNRLSTFSAPPMEAILTTTEFGGMELFKKPNERLYVNGIRPHVDGGVSTVSLNYRDTPQALISTDGPSVVDSNGVAHFTRSCRYARATVTIAAGGTWSHAQGVDMDVAEDGES
tara:strand:+ start:7445 stop:8947 length:1503 start_codon:yes stop_codon:yes gene_type:complete